MAFESWNEIVWADKGVQPSHQPASRRTFSFVLFVFSFFFVRLSAPNNTTCCHIGLTVCRFVSCREIKQNFRLFQFSPRTLSYLASSRGPLKVGLITHPKTDYSSTLRSRGLRTSPKRFAGKVRRYQLTTHLTRFPARETLLVVRLRRENPKLADDITTDGRKTIWVCSFCFVSRITNCDRTSRRPWVSFNLADVASSPQNSQFLDYFRFHPEPSRVFFANTWLAVAKEDFNHWSIVQTSDAADSKEGH